MPTETQPKHTPQPLTTEEIEGYRSRVTGATPFPGTTPTGLEQARAALDSWHGRLLATLDARAAHSSELAKECRSLLCLIDGLPWHLRDAVYKAFNERTGGLPGSLPSPITSARAAISKAGGSK